MAGRRSIVGVPVERLRTGAAILATVALLVGCVAGTGSPSPAGTSSPSPAGPSAASSNGPPAPMATRNPTGTPTPITGGSWQPAGTMVVERWGPVLLALDDGRALALDEPSDTESCGDCSNAELYDPATNTWRATARTGQPRERFVAVALADGRVLVTGGLTIPTGTKQPQSISSTVIYDPATETWAAAGLLHTARTDAIGALLPDGRVLVAGGAYYTGYATTGDAGGGDAVLAAYRPGPTGPDASAGERPDDSVPEVVGVALATAEVFDPATGRWTSTGPMHYARLGVSAVTLADGRVLIVGTSDWAGAVEVDHRAFDTAEIYDARTGRFSLTGGLPTLDRAAIAPYGQLPEGDPDMVESNGTLVALPDGDAILLGRHDSWKHQADLVRSFRYEAASGTWTEIGPTWASGGGPLGPMWTTPGAPRGSEVPVALLTDGRILVASGSSAGSQETAASTYDPVADTWTALPSMPTTRWRGIAVTLADGSVLIVGGSLDDGTIAPAIRFVPGGG